MISVLNPVKASMDNRILHSMTRIIATALLVFACTQAVGDTQLDWQSPAVNLADSDGQNLRYPDDLDGPAIVLFWASWCPYCKALMPHLQSIVDEYDGEIEILALNFRDDDDPREYISERGFDSPREPHRYMI